MLTLQLAIVEGPEEGGRYEFRQREVVVGSDFASDMILADSGVQPRHVRIEDRRGEICVEDLTGNNGAKLNGEFFTLAPLHNGDELQIGPYVFHVSMQVDLAPEEEKGLSLSGRFLLKKCRILRQPPALALLSLFGILVIYLSISSVTHEKVSEDLSLRGPVSLPADGIYGCRVKGKSYVDKVEFIFLAKGPKYRIQYYPGYIDNGGLVRVTVNNEPLGWVPVTYDRWSDEALSIDVPDSYLRIGESNVIRFDNVQNPPYQNRWGIRDVSVQEVPVVKCDAEVARKYLNLASKKYDEREIAEGNLYDAIKYLKEGQEYVLACKDAPVRDELSDALKLYSEELDQIYSRLMFNARKFVKLSDFDSARSETERALLFVPDVSDRRHERAQGVLDELKRVAP